MSKIKSRTSLRIMNSSVYSYLTKNNPSLLDKFFPEQAFGSNYVMKEEVFINYLNTGSKNKNIKTLNKLQVSLPDLDSLPNDVKSSLCANLDLLFKYYPESKEFHNMRYYRLKESGDFLSIRSLYYDKYLEYLKLTNSKYYLFRYVKDKIKEEHLDKYSDIVKDIQETEFKHNLCNFEEGIVALTNSSFGCIDKDTGIVFSDFREIFDKHDINKELEYREFLSIRRDLEEIHVIFPKIFNLIINSKYFHTYGLDRKSLRYLLKNNLIGLDKVSLESIFYTNNAIIRDLKRHRVRSLNDLCEFNRREIERRMTFGVDIVRILDSLGIKLNSSKKSDDPVITVKQSKIKPSIQKPKRVNGQWVYS